MDPEHRQMRKDARAAYLRQKPRCWCGRVAVFEGRCRGRRGPAHARRADAGRLRARGRRVLGQVLGLAVSLVGAAVVEEVLGDVLGGGEA